MKKRLAFLISLLVLVWLVVAGLVSSVAYRDARSGQRSLVSATRVSDLDSAHEAQMEKNLSVAASKLHSAKRLFSGIVLSPVRPIPVAGHQLNAAIHLSDAGAQSAEIALDAFRRAKPLLSGEQGDRVSSLEQLAAICRDSDVKLRAIRIGDRSGTVGAVRRAHDEAAKNLNEVDQGLVRGGAASAGLANLLGKQANYLVIAANNAEMRSGSGMFLSAGLMQTGGGSLHVSNLQSVAGLAPDEKLVSWPDEYEKNWGWLGHRNAYQNLMLSPQFDVSARLAKQLWEAKGNPAVDGVVVVDVDTLKALLYLTGPVSANGLTIDSGNVEHALMFDQYKLIDQLGSNQSRREAISGLAPGVFDAFNKASWRALDAARRLSTAANGRHLMLWSADETLNNDWLVAGVGGALGSDSMQLSLINLGTNKLDQFMQVDADIATDRYSSSVDSSVVVKITNNAPADGPQYVLGPVDNSGLQPGEYQGLLSFVIPGDATAASFEGNPQLVTSGKDGNNVQIATRIELRRGESLTLTLHFARPPSAVGADVEPGARIPATHWRYGSDAWVDSHSRDILY